MNLEVKEGDYTKLFRVLTRVLGFEWRVWGRDVELFG